MTRPASRDVPRESIDLQIADVLRAATYPANKDALVDAARRGCDGLPEQDYADVAAVTKLIGSNFGPGLGA
jgi:hypothetical protein